MEPPQTEIQNEGQKPPSVSIILEYDKKDPNIYTIKPTRESVRALAEWYRIHGVRTDMNVPISGPEIGSKELR